MTVLKISELGVSFGGHHVLRDVTFSLQPGEIVTIVGPNGSGKSTLLRAIIGAIPLSAGTIRRAPGLRVGYVPQKLSIDPTLPITVERFLSLPRRVAPALLKDALARAGSEDLGTQQMTQLSGGQLQKVLLAQALLPRPQLLLLDEASQGLDQPGQAAFYERINEVRTQTNCAVLMVSHDLHVVMAATDRVLCINGHICCQGPPALVTSAPEYRALFGSGTRGTLALYQHQHDHHHHSDNPAE